MTHPEQPELGGLIIFMEQETGLPKDLLTAQEPSVSCTWNGWSLKSGAVY